MVTVNLAPFVKAQDYDRVICVPFHVRSGNIGIGAPDDWPHATGFQLEPAHYRLCAAQKMVGEDEEEVIDLFFEKLAQPICESEILLADSNLDPPKPLLEDSPGL